jgi:hypothetical protein
MGYLVSHQGQEMNSLSFDEIVDRIRSKELDPFDYIFDEAKQDWVLLMEHPEIQRRLKAQKPPQPKRVLLDSTEVVPAAALAPTPIVPTRSVETSAHAIGDWHLMKGENKFGPFQYQDIVKMLQQKIVYPFDMVWNQGMNDWKRVAELADFHPEAIRQLYSEAKDTNGVFIQRQFKRSKFSGRVILHDNLTLWKGQGFEISKGGAGVKIQNALIVPGQQIFAHFVGHGEWPAFNAQCEVVSKKFVNDNSPVEYGLRFLSLSQDAQEEFYKRVS